MTSVLLICYKTLSKSLHHNRRENLQINTESYYFLRQFKVVLDSIDEYFIFQTLTYGGKTKHIKIAGIS